MKVIANYRRAAEVLPVLYKLYLDRGYPYSEMKLVVAPQVHYLPPSIKTQEEEACFYFFSCLFMRVGKSEINLKNLCSLYMDHPDLYDPFLAQNLDPELVLPVLKSYGLAPDYNARYWVENAKRLVRRYDGNPIRIFDGVEKAKNPSEEAYKRLVNDRKGHGFFGFGKKITDLLIIFLMKPELIPKFFFHIPVDVHARRFSLSSGFIRIIGLKSDQTIPGANLDWLDDEIRKVVFKVCINLRLNPITLNEAIWMFSPRMCSRTPSAKTKESGSRDHGTDFKYFKVDWKKKSDLIAYETSCGCCPAIIEEGCKLTVASSEVYNLKTLTLLRREKPPLAEVPQPIIQEPEPTSV